MVTANDVKKAIYYLGKKNLFKKIVLQFNLSDLHFVLHGRWTLAKLKCTGLLIGKDAYRQYYTMQPGEPFDIAKHNDACNSIEQTFLHQGYCDGIVTSDLQKDTKTKTITTILHLQRGPQYTIGTVTLKLTSPTTIEKKSDNMQQLCKTIKSCFLNSLAGHTYNKNTIREKTKALHHYLGQKGFLQPTIELQEKIIRTHKKVDLIFRVHVQHKNYFAFSGNHYFSDTQLRNALLEFGSSASLLPTPILAQELQKMYHDKGFWHTTITSQENTSQTLFTIEEGPRATIKAIEFSGVQHFDKEQLASNHFLSFVRQKYFDTTYLKQALDSLLAFYMQQGFWQITVLKTDFIPHEKQHNWYTMRITLDEQQQTYLGTAHVPGHLEAELYLSPLLHTTDSNTQNKQIELKSKNKKKNLNNSNNIPFNFILVQQQREKLTTFFTKRGYSTIQLKPKYTQQLKEKHCVIDIDWHVTLDTKEKRFGKTIIQSNSAFNTTYIMRELAYKEKEAWNQNALKKTINNLKELSIFEHIHLQQDHTYPFDNEQPLILNIQHDDPFEVRTRAGFALRQLSKHFVFGGVTYTAGGTFLYKNPFERGDLIRANVDISRSHRTVQLQYHMPWFFKWPVRTLVQGYTNKHVQPGTIDELKHVYDVTQQGFLLGTHRTWHYVQMGSTVGIEWSKTEVCDDCQYHAIDETHIANAINFAPQLLDKNIAYLMIEPSFFINYLDNTLKPTRGSLSVISCKGMFPLSTIGIRAYLLKIMAEQSFFIPILPFVIAIRIRIGHIFHEQFYTINPTERFYLGGAHSIRSYETDMVPPLGKITNKSSHISFVPQGGKSMFSVNLEVRFPLYKELGAVLFHDIGTLSTSGFADIRTKNVVGGTGLGLRYDTPIGPIRFDVAFKWHKPDPSITRYAWFLTIGHAF